MKIHGFNSYIWSRLHTLFKLGRERDGRGARWWFAGVGGWLGIAVLPVLLVISAAFAATKPDAKAVAEPKIAGKFETPGTAEKKIKLNYYSASWPRVFQDLTDFYGMELISEQVPEGRFSRYDTSEHSRRHALRIVNQQLEPQGFRLIEKGKYLILLETTLQRPLTPGAANLAYAKTTDADEIPKKRGPQIDGAEMNSIRQTSNQVRQSAGGSSSDVCLLKLQHVDSDVIAEILTLVYEPLPQRDGQIKPSRSPVTITAVSKTNSVRIVAEETDLDSIRHLVEQLDAPVNSQAEFQVFRLQAEVTTNAETLLAQFHNERRTLGRKVLVIAEPRSNAIIVRAQPQELDEFESWISMASARSADSTSFSIRQSD